METTAASRRQPQPPPPRLPFDLDGKQRCDYTAGGGGGCCLFMAWGAPSPSPAGSAGSRAFWTVWFLVAGLCFPTLVFVSGAYRPPLAFISSFYWGTASQKHQHRLVHGAPPPPTASARDSSVADHDNIMAPSPSPTQGVRNLSYAAVLHDVPASAPSPTPVASGFSDAKVYTPSTAAVPSRSSDAEAHDDKLLGGLLAAGFDEATCQSRYQSFAYRKASPHKPSPYLQRRLRDYESLHRRCGPLTRSYKRSLHLLKPGGRGGGGTCKYVVWNPENGLGNRMLSMASAFLYALLSRRVLLIDGSTDLAGLFCEPFPGSTWLLPQDFPLRHLPFGQKFPHSYGNLLRANRLIAADEGGGPPPAFIYAHLSNDYDDHDKRFYCEPDQVLLQGVPWMVLRSDQYFVPALFLNPAFERELRRLFPEKEAVFHHLGRYLFHPSNDAWGLITEYHRDHLAPARERLGIQIRVFDSKNKPFELILRQILNCTLSEKLLPEVDDLRTHATTDGAGGHWPTKAVLLTSLHSVFYERMKEMYRAGRSAEGGEVVSFHQPSHEEEQRTGRAAHDAKALAEMYLLSLTDALVTSSWSTFGYVAQGLGGMTPWVLRGPVHLWVPEPACVRDVSPEPCFHFPPDYDCRARRHADMAKLLPYTRHCKDFRRGVKLVDVRG